MLSTPSSSWRRGAVAATAVALAAIGAAAPVNAAPAPTAQVPGTVPTWLGRAQQQVTAKVASGATTSVRVYLQPRGGSARLEAAALAMSTPGSASYRHFLSVDQYNATYQPTAATAATVAFYLTGRGLTDVQTDPARRFVTAAGTTAQLASAFGVTLSHYRHDGQDVVANSTPVTLPASLAANVLTVTGLDTTLNTVQAAHVVDGATTAAKAAPAAGFPAGGNTARPCNAQYGVLAARYEADMTTKLPAYRGTVLPYAPCGYTGTQMRGVYTPFSDLVGSGAKIGIVDAFAAPRAARDAATYAARNGDARYAPGQYTESLPASFRLQQECDAPGWSVEQLLDIEAAHGMAPAAAIRYYGARSCANADIADTLARVVDENTVDVVSNSYGGPEALAAAGDIATVHQILLQGGVQGISFLFSSGDSGDFQAATAVKTVSYPASDPMATAVGGTSTGVVSGVSTSTWTTVTGWGTGLATLSDDGKSWENQGFLYGSGGGYSTAFNRPTYQTGRVPASAPVGRAVPDISANADTTTGLLIGLTQSFPDGVHYGELRIGGTSLASPLLGGWFALAVGDTHQRLGLLNPLLYKAEQNQIVDVTGVADKGLVRADYVNRIDATDGVTYTIRTFNQDSSLTTTTGWDDVTGLGFPSVLLQEAIVGHPTRH